MWEKDAASPSALNVGRSAHGRKSNGGHMITRFIPPLRADATSVAWSRETLNDCNEVVVRGAGGIAKLLDLMFVREPVQAH